MKVSRSKVLQVVDITAYTYTYTLDMTGHHRAGSFMTVCHRTPNRTQIDHLFILQNVMSVYTCIHAHVLINDYFMNETCFVSKHFTQTSKYGHIVNMDNVNGR